MKRLRFLSILMLVLMPMFMACGGDDTKEDPESNNKTLPANTNNPSGTKWVKCNWCGGRATETCTRCNGVGYCNKCSNGVIKCTTCSGSGYKRGIIFNHSDPNVLCSSCKGKGTWACTICDGSGVCATCHSSGKISCHECNGHGGHYE